jgi:hypothetical protein
LLPKQSRLLLIDIVGPFPRIYASSERKLE